MGYLHDAIRVLERPQSDGLLAVHALHREPEQRADVPVHPEQPVPQWCAAARGQYAGAEHLPRPEPGDLADAHGAARFSERAALAVYRERPAPVAAAVAARVRL